MKQKLTNKQAIVPVFIYARMTAAEPAWRGQAPHQTAGQRRARGDHGRRLCSDGFFLVPGRSAWPFLIAGSQPTLAGDFGVSGRHRVPPQHPSAADVGRILEVPIGTLVLSPGSGAGVPTSLLPRRCSAGVPALASGQNYGLGG